MTIYEHVMLGVDGALAAGLHRRYGWQIVAWAGCAAVLPDWDGLTLLLGSQCYAAGHRVWGHNLLVAGLSAVILGMAACRWGLFAWLGRVVGGWGKAKPAAEQRPESHGTGALGHASLCPGHPSWALLCVWATVGLAATYSHLAMDVLYSYGRDLPVWDVPLLWPFSKRGFACPAVPWGDPGTTLIFAAGMLAMARWRSATQRIAVLTLVLVAVYIVVRGLVVAR